MNGWFPRFNARGDIASGAGEIFVNDRAIRRGHAPHWLTDDTLLAKGDDDRPYAVTVATGTREALGTPGPSFAAGGGVWMVAHPPIYWVTVSRQGRRAWIAEGPSGNNDRTLLMENDVIRSHVPVSDPRVEDGYLTWSEKVGSQQQAWGLRPGGQPERLRVSDTEWEGMTVPVLTPDGPWVVLQTQTDLRIFPWGETEGYIIPTGDNNNLHPDAIYLDGAIRVVCNTSRGERLVFVHSLTVPRTSILMAAPPVDVSVGRALWMGFYEFVPANTPGNCDLVVERDQPFLYLRDHDGRELATYVAGNPDGDPDAIERAVAATKAARPDLPCIAYVPFSKTQGRYVRAPENADVIGVEGYWKVGETDFEARWRRECEAHPRVALIPQCYTSNTDNILDLRAIVPVAARIARDVSSVAYVLPFSGSGRETGYQDHPEVHDLWTQFAASITTPEDITMPNLKSPEITVTAWTLDELRDGREFAFVDRENPDLGYGVRVFVRDGSMYAEMRNAAGTGATGARRPVKLAPEPAPPPPPPPPPPPTWEEMVRTTIRAVYAEDGRRPPRQADEDFILEQCYAPPRGAGWQASDIQAYVRALPRETAPGSRIAGRIRVEGRHFVNNAGVFRPRFASALTALAKSQDQVEAYLDWAQRQGFNGIRVFAGHLAWAGQTADSARSRLPWLLAETHRRGLYIEVTALTDTREGKYDKPQHVQQITALCRDHEHTLSEIANEPFHATQDHEVQDPEYLVRLFKEIVQPSGVTCAIGAPSFDEPNRDGKFPFPVADYSTLHLDRGRDPWNMVRRVRELEAVSSVTGTPALNNESIGADEHPRLGSRVSDPSIFFAMGVQERIFEVGGVHHSTAGLQCELPGIVQQACADAYIAGATAIPTDALLEFKNARRPDADGADSFMIWGNFPDDSHTGTVLRAFTGIDGDRAWTAVVGITGDPELEFRHGWRLVQVLDERPGVQLLELAR